MGSSARHAIERKHVDRPARVDRPELLLAAEFGFDLLARIASRLDGFAHLARRASRLFGLVGDFVLLTASHLGAVLRTSTIRFSHRCLHWLKSRILRGLATRIC